MRTNENQWLLDAACRGVVGPPFYTNDDGDNDQADEARRFCDRCPARTECLLEALHTEQGLPVHRRHGIWAGYTPSQRERVEKRKWVVCPKCGATLDPTVVRSGRLRCPTDARHLNRRVPKLRD